MIEAVKKAEDSDDIVLRLYEFENTRSKVSLAFACKVKRIWLCDMMENRQELLAEEKAECSFIMKPFEITTLMAELDGIV